MEVELMGQKFRLKSENGEEYIKKASEYVNREIQRVAKGSGSADSLKIALLTAVNIAENYFLEVDNQRAMVDGLLVKTNKLIDYVDTRESF